MDCVAKVKAYVEEQGLKISGKRLDELGLMIRTAGGDALSTAEIHAKVQNSLETDVRQFNARTQAEKLQDLARQAQAHESIRNKEFGTTLFENLRAWLDGSSAKKGDAINLDPKRMTAAAQNQLAPVWSRAIEGYSKEAGMRGGMFKDSLVELWALQHGLPVGKSGNTAAQVIAKAAYALENSIVEQKKTLNPWFEPIQDYLIRSIHDRTKVSGVERGQWIGDALKAFGEKSFPELSDTAKIQAFGDIYDRIKAGTFGSLSETSNPNIFQKVEGTGGDILRRMTRERSLLISSPEAFFDYASKYGFDNMNDAMQRVIRSAGKDIAFLSKYGSKPADTVEAVINRTLRYAEPGERDQIMAKIPLLQREFTSIMGATDAPAQGRVAKVLQAAQAWEYMAKSSGILRAFPDVALAAARMRDFTGKNIAGNALEIMVRTFSKLDLTGKASREALNDIGMAAHTSIGDVLANMGAAEGVPGSIAKAADAWGSLTFHKQWVDSLRNAVGQMITQQVARLKDTPWAELPYHYQDGFKRYGISESGHEALMQSPVDRGMLTPEATAHIPDEAVIKMMRAEGRLGADSTPSAGDLKYEKYQLGIKYGTLIADHADFGTINPNSRQKAFMNQGRTADDPWGLALRLMLQFKAAAFITTEQYRRTYNSGKGLQGNMAGVASMAATSAFFYAIGEYATQLSQGKTPEDPTSPAMLAKIAIGSGLGGLTADMLEQSLHEQGIKGKAGAMATYLMGPTIGEGFNLAATGVQAFQNVGEGKDFPAGPLGKFMVDQAPGHNLFWTKALFDFYLANGFREFLQNGYLNNLEMHVNQKPGMFEQNQRYFMMPPTESRRWR